MKDPDIYGIEKVSAIILSAGQSERMGQSKALLPFDKSRTFIQNLIYSYFNSGIRDIIIVLNSQNYETIFGHIQDLASEFQLKIICNPSPEKGKLLSLKLATASILHGNHSFIQNIDNPFSNSSLLIQMIQKLAAKHFVVPSFGREKGHPVLLSKEIVKYLNLLDSEDKNFRFILNEFPLIELHSEDPKILANINTQDDYLNYFNHVSAYK